VIGKEKSCLVFFEIIFLRGQQNNKPVAKAGLGCFLGKSCLQAAVMPLHGCRAGKVPNFKVLAVRA